MTVSLGEGLSITGAVIDEESKSDFFEETFGPRRQWKVIIRRGKTKKADSKYFSGRSSSEEEKRRRQMTVSLGEGPSITGAVLDEESKSDFFESLGEGPSITGAVLDEESKSDFFEETFAPRRQWKVIIRRGKTKKAVMTVSLGEGLPITGAVIDEESKSDFFEETFGPRRQWKVIIRRGKTKKADQISKYFSGRSSSKEEKQRRQMTVSLGEGLPITGAVIDEESKSDFFEQTFGSRRQYHLEFQCKKASIGHDFNTTGEEEGAFVDHLEFQCKKASIGHDFNTTGEEEGAFVADI
ncbi:hypothetical protein QE152_g32251 [Popillia japonica]|uniref:Uncharacterized protein n=1 Tax=Popillia japonica TaxID=7064 RepID=A0AAW1IZX8_POPJA